uniref:Uncharacterized protein n=1 Tax=Palpitomonas bilix TaxID=652834 RepID=A0A7S3CXI4_9EUKA|mmetsp:Transcript_13432/g.35224  ORF Transcript_13432/g.35224 Transcript_13432/m.35224 type:complete len:575 (+) Transcript_13432:70-1794(+)
MQMMRRHALFFVVVTALIACVRTCDGTRNGTETKILLGSYHCIIEKDQQLSEDSKQNCSEVALEDDHRFISIYRNGANLTWSSFLRSPFYTHYILVMNNHSNDVWVEQELERIPCPFGELEGVWRVFSSIADALEQVNFYVRQEKVLLKKGQNKTIVVSAAGMQWPFVRTHLKVQSQSSRNMFGSGSTWKVFKDAMGSEEENNPYRDEFNVKVTVEEGPKPVFFLFLIAVPLLAISGRIARYRPFQLSIGTAVATFAIFIIIAMKFRSSLNTTASIFASIAAFLSPYGILQMAKSIWDGSHGPTFVIVFIVVILVSLIITAYLLPKGETSTDEIFEVMLNIFGRLVPAVASESMWSTLVMLEVSVQMLALLNVLCFRQKEESPSHLPHVPQRQYDNRAFYRASPPYSPPAAPVRPPEPPRRTGFFSRAFRRAAEVEVENTVPTSPVLRGAEHGEIRQEGIRHRRDVYEVAQRSHPDISSDRFVVHGVEDYISEQEMRRRSAEATRKGLDELLENVRKNPHLLYTVSDEAQVRLRRMLVEKHGPFNRREVDESEDERPLPRDSIGRAFPVTPVRK